jgi:hypothetical protein
VGAEENVLLKGIFTFCCLTIPRGAYMVE